MKSGVGFPAVSFPGDTGRYMDGSGSHACEHGIDSTMANPKLSVTSPGICARLGKNGTSMVLILMLTIFRVLLNSHVVNYSWFAQ